MRRLFLPWLLLIAPATSACGSERVIHFHEYISFGPPLVVGSDLSFTLRSQGQAPVSFRVPVPKLFGDYPQAEYYESDAARLGLDWNQLEALMAGPEIKEAIWGLPGQGSIQSFPYVVSEAPQVYAKVDLDRISVGYGWRDDRSHTFIWFDGDVYLVPEPSSKLLSLACFAMLAAAVRWQASVGHFRW